MWFSSYLWPSEITYDCGSEFLSHKFKNTLIEEEYGILTKPATPWNLQDNSITERTHKVLADLICTFDIKKNVYEDDPRKGIPAAADFDIRSTLHTTEKPWTNSIRVRYDYTNWACIQLEVNIST